VTSPDVTITNLTFYVIGTKPGDGVQPRVIIDIQGSAGNPGVQNSTTFHLQANAVQRVLDL
jgi:hypothetical protein